jgi:hypothetical protein
MNPVYGSILENLRAFKLVVEPTVDVFKGDRTHTGDSKEITVNAFISSYLPSDFAIKKGKIYSRTGESQNIDCVVLAPNHPRLITPVREVILAEGVYAAIEVKPDISVLTMNSELLRGLNQIKSIKNLDRKVQNITIPGGRQDDAPIPSVIFSFHSANPEKTVAFIKERLSDATLRPHEIPDVIFTLDNGIIVYTQNLSQFPLGKIIKEEVRKIYGESLFIHWDGQSQEVNLLFFLIIFLGFRPPGILLNRFFILDYFQDIEANLIRKDYPVDVNNKELLNAILLIFNKFPEAAIGGLSNLTVREDLEKILDSGGVETELLKQNLVSLVRKFYNSSKN